MDREQTNQPYNMTNRPSVRGIRSLTTVAAAIVIAAVVISAAIFASSALYVTVTKTVTTTTTWSTQNSTTTGSFFTSTSSSDIGASSFTYSPRSPVQIESVAVAESAGQNGTTDVTFQVYSKNVGTPQIYVVGGCGSGLSISVPGSSAALKQISNHILCECAESLMSLKSGQNNTSVDPGCWSRYYYALVGHGTAEVNMTLAWSTNSDFAGTNSTAIQAQFAF